jgi:hypothetical protein
MVTSITSFPFRPSRLHSSAGQGSGQRLSSRRRTFTQLVRTAGTIFAGTVTRIAPGPAAGGSAAPTVATTFHLEHPLAAGSFTILEWLGLWSSGQHYAVGEHVLLFLYALSKFGLSSAVGGALGRFQLDSARGILPSRQQVADFQPDPLFAGRSRIAFNDFSRALRQSVAE